MNADALRGTLVGNDAPRPTVGGAAAIAELSRWRVWSKGNQYMLGHAIDGDGPTREEWSRISRALDSLAPSNVGRAPEDAAAGSPQGAADPRR